MKRYGGLWDQLIAWDNLCLAARKAQRAKRHRPAVRHFSFDLENQLLRLRSELLDDSYRPGAFRPRWITSPKPRQVSAAPYRDCVVHHALINVLEPILERHFHPHSYACRKGKGTLAASMRLQGLMRKRSHALQCDIRKFFPSIDHELLKATFRRLIKDDRLLRLMDIIVDHSNAQEPVVQWFSGDDLLSPLSRRRGLPIGNLTSQWFANWMLNGLDHFVTSRLGIGAYVRYCDDFVLLHDDPGVLRDGLCELRQWLAASRLTLHESRAVIRPVRAGLTFVGFRTWGDRRQLKKQCIRRFRRRLRWMKSAYRRRKIDWADIKPRLAGWIGHAKHGASSRQLKLMSREWVFVRDEADRASRDSWRCVEQQRHQLHHDEHQQQRSDHTEQQHRLPFGPALSKLHVWNGGVHGCRPHDRESPGLIPESARDIICAGRIHGLDRMGLVGERPTAPSGLELRSMILVKTSGS